MTSVERIRPGLRVQVRYYVGVKGLMADEVRVIGDGRDSVDLAHASASPKAA